MKIEAVIFDLDGTLVNTIEDIADSANVLLTRYDFEPRTLNEYIGFIGNGALKFIESAMEGRVDQERLPTFVKEFKEIYGNNLHTKSCVYEGINRVLNAYQKGGVKMAILSNKPHHLTLNVVDYYLSNWKFKAVFGQRDQVPRKPDPAAANEISAMLGAPAAHTLFVGDSRGDMLTAHAAGMIPVGVNWGYGKPGADIINDRQVTLDQPEELIKIIKN
jgi:phosphoglycolate phosphatase